MAPPAPVEAQEPEDNEHEVEADVSETPEQHKHKHQQHNQQKQNQHQQQQQQQQFSRQSAGIQKFKNKTKGTFKRIAVDPSRNYHTPEARESWGPNVKGKKFRKEKGKKKRSTGTGARIDGSVKSVRLDA